MIRSSYHGEADFSYSLSQFVISDKPIFSSSGKQLHFPFS